MPRKSTVQPAAALPKSATAASWRSRRDKKKNRPESNDITKEFDRLTLSNSNDNQQSTTTAEQDVGLCGSIDNKPHVPTPYSCEDVKLSANLTSDSSNLQKPGSNATLQGPWSLNSAASVWNQPPNRLPSKLLQAKSAMAQSPRNVHQNANPAIEPVYAADLGETAEDDDKLGADPSSLPTRYPSLSPRPNSLQPSPSSLLTRPKSLQAARISLPPQPKAHQSIQTPLPSRPKFSQPPRTRRPKPKPEYLLQAEENQERLGIRHRLLVILDLNGTLVHRNKSRKTLAERPCAQDLLNYLFENHAVMVWSSAQPDNVDMMCKKMFSSEQMEKLVGIWNRSNLNLSKTQYEKKVQVYKQLSWVWRDAKIQASSPDWRLQPWSQANTVLLDDSEEKAASEPYNVIKLNEFDGKDSGDRTLLDVVRFLDHLCVHTDVSTVLKKLSFAQYQEQLQRNEPPRPS